MSKKKRKRKEMEAAAAALAVGGDQAEPEERDETAPRPAGITRGQRLLSIVGFGFCGFLAALLTGANYNPPLPGELSGLALASWEGAVLGSRVLDLGRGAVDGLGGLLLGGALGFSIFLSPVAFILNWLGGGLLGYAAWHFSGSFVLAALGWLVGSMLPLALGKLARS